MRVVSRVCGVVAMAVAMFDFGTPSQNRAPTQTRELRHDLEPLTKHFPVIGRPYLRPGRSATRRTPSIQLGRGSRGHHGGKTREAPAASST
jgi:hypothetical protein